MKRIFFILFVLISIFPTVAFGRETIPRVDEEAAYTERYTEEIREGKTAVDNSADYSLNFWMFLFGVYLFLLIFNLSFEFGKRRELQWFWETVYTFLAIFAWDNLDVGRTNPWFPAVVMESGVIIYAFYFYFLNKKLDSRKKYY